jgi:hypothetical protein
MKDSLRNRIFWLVAFSVAMGFLEAAVVVYLRELYYPNGFGFPLILMSDTNAVVELLREGATIIMLLGIGMLAGRTPNERFSFFLSSFAIWDIFYYVFLKAFLDWPDSFLTWDILFLIPVPWIGPVIDPIIISLTMILLSGCLVFRDQQSTNNKLSTKEWSLLIAGSLVVIGSWTWEYLQYSFSVDDPITAINTFVPQTYSWMVFWVGEALLLLAIYLFWRTTKLDQQ